MDPQIRKILFTTDLSENSRHAFNYAASLATRYGGGLIILHVMEKLPTGVEQRLSAFFGKEKWGEIRREQQRDARQILIGKQREHDIIRNALKTFCNLSNITVDDCSFQSPDILFREGRIIQEIVSVARETECGLIVMGAHKGLLGATAVGSVTKGVLHESPIPVLVVPPAGTA